MAGIIETPDEILISLARVGATSISLVRLPEGGKWRIPGWVAAANRPEEPGKADISTLRPTPTPEQALKKLYREAINHGWVK